jgi:hypothetical protein
MQSVLNYRNLSNAEGNQLGMVLILEIDRLPKN